jgi:hypothetical protein
MKWTGEKLCGVRGALVSGVGDGLGCSQQQREKGGGDLSVGLGAVLAFARGWGFGGRGGT